MRSKVTRRHPFQWLLESVEAEPSFFQKPMFGCQAVYLFGKLVLVLAAQEEPWNGLLVCTSREFHSALIGEYPGLQPHPALRPPASLPRIALPRCPAAVAALLLPADACSRRRNVAHTACIRGKTPPRSAHSSPARKPASPTSPTLSCFALVASSRNIATPALAPAR